MTLLSDRMLHGLELWDLRTNKRLHGEWLEQAEQKMMARYTHNRGIS